MIPKKIAIQTPHVRGADSGFSETYTEYVEEKTQVSVTKQMGMYEWLSNVNVSHLSIRLNK